MENYLEHSKKGTSWAKTGAKYISRIKKNGKWVYTYKLRKAKDVVKKAAVNVKEDQEMRERIENQKARDKKTKKLRSKKYKAVNKVRGYVNTYKIRKHEKDMKKYSDSQVKKHKEMLHTMSNDYGYLIHSKGPWKDHKYTAKKTGKNGKPVYIYSEYKEGDKDFDDNEISKMQRVGDTDGFVKTNPDGTVTLVEEDMKWTFPKGTKVTEEMVLDLLDNWKEDSRKYNAAKNKKEQEVYKKREQTARTATESDLSAAKRAKAVANAYKDQQDAAERRGQIIAEAYAEQKKKEKKSMAHGADIEGYGYLIHSAKGSTWEKKNHKYKKKIKVNGVWRYVYFDEKDLSDKEKAKLREEESRINREGTNYNVRTKADRDREHEQYMKDTEGSRYLEENARALKYTIEPKEKDMYNVRRPRKTWNLPKNSTLADDHSVWTTDTAGNITSQLNYNPDNEWAVAAKTSPKYTKYKRK